MLKSCTYCGRIHDKKHICALRPQRKKANDEKDRFRSTQAWQKKRAEIKRRDLFLCQICIRNLYDTDMQYTYKGLEVHHAIPLADNFERRLDDDNLLTVCGRHHEMAERGEISKNVMLEIIQEQNCKNDIPPLGRDERVRAP